MFRAHAPFPGSADGVAFACCALTLARDGRNNLAHPPERQREGDCYPHGSAVREQVVAEHCVFDRIDCRAGAGGGAGLLLAGWHAEWVRGYPPRHTRVRAACVGVADCECAVARVHTHTHARARTRTHAHTHTRARTHTHSVGMPSCLAELCASVAATLPRLDTTCTRCRAGTSRSASGDGRFTRTNHSSWSSSEAAQGVVRGPSSTPIDTHLLSGVRFRLCLSSALLLLYSFPRVGMCCCARQN